MKMNYPELIILDVGHGNCAILRDNDSITIIDAPARSFLTDALESLGITRIKQILISHADADHVEGLVSLLQKDALTIENVYINADSLKKTMMWEAVRRSLAMAQSNFNTKLHVELSPNSSEMLNDDDGTVKIEVLGPAPDLILAGTGGKDLSGRSLDSNSLSVVVKLLHDKHPLVLLAGDLDGVALENLLEKNIDMKAEILVFPHHGGKPKNMETVKFTRKLCSAVQPKLVVFSIGRDKYRNPQPEIIRTIIADLPEAHILCTQLSRNCSERESAGTSGHLADIPARGRDTNNCCGGSISIKFNGSNTDYDTVINSHGNFVSNHVSGAICRQAGRDVRRLDPGAADAESRTY